MIHVSDSRISIFTFHGKLVPPAVLVCKSFMAACCSFILSVNGTLYTVVKTPSLQVPKICFVGDEEFLEWFGGSIERLEGGKGEKKFSH